jgi:septal ring factor EnvC (AmiA/AmiB activator)
MQTEPSVTTEARPKSRVNLVTLTLSIFLAVFFIAALGLWLYGNSLDAQTATVRGQEADLQAQYDALTDEKNDTSAELAQTKTELANTQASLEETKASLEKAKTDLANAQTSLSKAQEDLTSLQERAAKAVKYVQIGIAMYVDGVDFDRLQKYHDEVDDPELQAKYDTLLETESNDAFINWLAQLYHAISETLDVE